MAEIKVEQRQVAQPSAPDLSAAAESYAYIDKAMQRAAHTVGDVVLAKREAAAKKAEQERKIDEKNRVAGAKADLARLALKYKYDPNITAASVNSFNQEAAAVAQGWMDGAHPESMRSLEGSLSRAASSSSTRLLDISMREGLRRQNRDLSLSVNDLIETAASHAAEGEYGQLAETQQDLDHLLGALKGSGAGANELIRAKKNFEERIYEAQGIAQLKRAQSQEERVQIMQDMSKLPDSEAANKAFNKVYSTFSKYNKLYAEGLDLSGPLNNILEGKSAYNLSVPTKQADKLVNMIAKNMAAQTEGLDEEQVDEVRNTQMQVQSAQAQNKTYRGQAPATGQPETYEFNEEIQPKKEKGPAGFYAAGQGPVEELAEEIVQAEEKVIPREPTMQEYAIAHVKVGSKNANVFSQMASNAFANGTGQRAYEATMATNYVYDTAPATLDLDKQTEVVYTEMKMGIAAGRTDYDQLIKEARETVARISQVDIKSYNDIFNNQYSTTGGPGLKNTNKAFKEATGVDAVKTGSQEALNDFYHIYKKNFLATNGSQLNALDMTKRQMAQTHGDDVFSPIVGDQESIADLLPIGSFKTFRPTLKYVRFPPSVMMPYASEKQINNQLTEQLVRFSEVNKNVQVPESYKKIKTANDFEKAEQTFVVPDKISSGGVLTPVFANHITQTVPGIGTIKGRVFLKSNNLTVQNNSGAPVWEVWMQDDQGRTFPVYDNKSPVNNTLLFIGQTPEQFAPEWAAAQDEEAFDRNVKEVLNKESRQVYPRVGATPVLNYKARKSYESDIKNIERVKKKIKSITDFQDQGKAP